MKPGEFEFGVLAGSKVHRVERALEKVSKAYSGHLSGVLEEASRDQAALVDRMKAVDAQAAAAAQAAKDAPSYTQLAQATSNIKQITATLRQTIQGTVNVLCAIEKQLPEQDRLVQPANVNQYRRLHELVHEQTLLKPALAARGPVVGLCAATTESPSSSAGSEDGVSTGASTSSTGATATTKSADLLRVQLG